MPPTPDTDGRPDRPQPVFAKETLEDYGAAAEPSPDRTHEPAPFDLRPAGFFALRTPLLPFDTLVDWGAGLSAPDAADGTDLERAVEEDRRRLEARLDAIVGRPDVREALFLGSPDLEAAVPVWQARPGDDRGRGIARALVRYLARMAGRPTPFGLFAGCSVGTLGERTRLLLSADGHTRRSRLSVDYLAAAMDEARGDPGVGDGVVYRPNQSLYPAAGTVRWVEGHRTGRRSGYRLVGAEADRWLSLVMVEAASGATLETLAAALGAAGVPGGAAEEYVGRLVADQLLMAEPAPPVTGPEPLDVIVDEMRGLDGGAATSERVERAGALLGDLDRVGVGNPPSEYRRLAADLEPLPDGVTLAGLVHVDLVKSSPQATLGPAVVAELSRAAHILHRLAAARPWPPMDRFRLAFGERYGSREVPLTEALDCDTGIGFGPRLTTAVPIEGLPVARPSTGDGQAWTRREQMLVAKVTAAATAGEREIELSGSDIDEMAEAAGGPDAYGMAMVAAVAAASDDDLDRGRFQVVVRALAAPSGALLLARFCHADAEMADHVRRLVAAEEALDPDALFAEVVHLPAGPLGNVVLRPALRHYEIPYLGRSGVPPDRQIPACDLMVSVVGNRVVLRSRRLDRRIVPRITNAHSFMRSGLPLYQFLGALQSEAAFLPWWDWGRLGGLAFLPRVSAGRLVLAPARWRLDADALARFRELRSARDAARFAAVQRWRTDVGAPRWLAVGKGGEGVVVDLDNVVSVDAFVHVLGDGDEAVMEELVGGPGQLCAQGPQGRFASEVVVPFLRVDATHVAPRPPQSPLQPHAPPERFPRRFVPGSEWLQAELYGPPTAADRLLCEVVHPLIRQVRRSGAAASWFFVRYFSPSPHLRVRFNGSGDRLRAEVEPALHVAVADAMAEGLLWKVALATYEREVERYGGAEGVALAERLFAADSEAAVEVVRMWPGGDEGLWQRWRLALCGVDHILDDLGLAVTTKLEVAGGLRRHAAALVGPGPALEAELSRRFRAERRQIEALVEGPLATESDQYQPLVARSAAVGPIVAELDVIERAGRLTVSRPELAASCVHMHVNRMLRSEHRAQELVIYDFLSRVYRSQAARGGGE